MNTLDTFTMSIPENTLQFEALLSHIKLNRGFDFTGYKRPSLVRRIDRRLQTLQLDSYERYMDYLEVHPDEFTYLFNTILINVTNFFRDRATWDFISEEIIPLILKTHPADESIRVWSAGCSTGQEAYTIAMLLAEQLGIEAFIERVKIYATDLDEEALQVARQATYTQKEVLDIPEDLLEKYFEHVNGSYLFRKDLRRCIIFGRHDLVQNPPISRVDLLICRNILMYFSTETQNRILNRLHFALKENGLLVLGKAEMLFSYTSLFTPYNLKRRIFTKSPKVTFRERIMVMPPATRVEDESADLVRHVRFREIAFDSSTFAQVVVDLNGFLVLVNERARSLLNISPEDVSKPLHELEIMYRIPELKSRIDDVYRERRLMTIKDYRWSTISGDVRYLELQISPMIDTNSRLLGVSILFVDMTAFHLLQEENERAGQELEVAYETLQSTNEELETTNEELQSTIEELETTNEELQSTNEELETINEELQSTNEELQTMNDETSRRGEDLNQVNNFLEAILVSLGSGVVVLNQSHLVQAWSRKAEELWGLRSAEVINKNFFSLDIGLPVEQLSAPIRECLAGEPNPQPASINAVNRRGKAIKCVVTCSPLIPPSATTPVGVLLMMKEEVESP